MAKRQKKRVVPPKESGKPGGARLKVGRPSLLTPKVTEDLVAAVVATNSLEDAARYVGLERSTVFRWMQKGRAEEDGEYRDFFNAIEDAKAQRAMNIQTQMLVHGKKTWQALAWLAERTDPKRFGLRIKVQVNEELERMMNKLEKHLKPEEFERALEAIAQPDDSPEEAGGEESGEGPGGSGLAAGVRAATVAALSEPGPSP